MEPSLAATPNLLERWLRFTAPLVPPVTAPLAERENARRGRLATYILTALLVLAVAVLPIGLSDPVTFYIEIGTVILSLIGLFLNRLGYINLVGTLLAITTSVSVAAVILDAPRGQLSTPDVSLFDLFVIPELIIAALLPPLLIFGIAFVNSLFIVAVLFWMPHTSELGQYLASDLGLSLIFRPVAVQLIVALVTFLLVRSVLTAIARADLAEEMAAIEHRERQRARNMEDDVRNLLEAHVRLANGDFRTPVPNLKDPILWQIGNSLNTLIARLLRMSQAEFMLQRTGEDAQRLVEGLQMLRRGSPPLWPVPSGTPLDQVILMLREMGQPRGPTNFPGPR